MSSTSSRGGAKLRQPPHTSKSTPVKPAALFEGSGNLLDFIKPDYVSSALTIARGQSPNSFRRTQKAWLTAHIATLASSLEITYELAIADHGINTADAILQGALLGSGVVQRAIEEKAIPLDDCKQNVVSSGIIGGIIHTTDFEQQELAGYFSQDTIDAFWEVRTPAARTMACAVVGFTCKAN